MPIIPGLKILNRQSQLTSHPAQLLRRDPRRALGRGARRRSPSRCGTIGVEWAHRQVEELLDRGVLSVHFYVMQSAAAIKALMARLSL